MEAKVDVRKLQMLNDRIAQTIEALHQVRLSVYGLSHSPGLPPNVPFVTPNLPFQGYGMANYNYPGMFPGLQHTPFTPQFQPYQPYPQYQQFPFLSGLSHTTPDLFEPRMFEFKPFDPYRIQQTFPYIDKPYFEKPFWPTPW